MPQPIPHDQVERIAVLFGRNELRQPADGRSFTWELHRLLAERQFSVQFGRIEGEVNRRWEQAGGKQRCRADYTQCGENWENFYWP